MYKLRLPQKTKLVFALDGMLPHGTDLKKDWKVPRKLNTYHGAENALIHVLLGSNGIAILLNLKV